MSTSQSTHLTTAEPWTTDNRYKLRLESSQIYREIEGKYLFTLVDFLISYVYVKLATVKDSMNNM